MNDALFEALWVSLRVAGQATALLALPAVALGWLLARRSFRGKSLVEAFVALPLVLPPTAIGFLLLRLFARNGPLPFDAGVLLTERGAVLAAAVMALPLASRTARVAIEGVPARLEQAGRTLGLTDLAVAWRITIPLAWRGILAALFLGFARALGEFGATILLAGNLEGETRTLALAIYTEIQRADGSAMPFVAVAALLALILVALVEHLGRAPVRGDFE